MRFSFLYISGCPVFISFFLNFRLSNSYLWTWGLFLHSSLFKDVQKLYVLRRFLSVHLTLSSIYFIFATGDILYTGLLSPHVIFALLHLKRIRSRLKFAQTQRLFETVEFVKTLSCQLTTRAKRTKIKRVQRFPFIT